ncbi:glycosyl transferase, partial [Gluconobacter thailandicus]
MSDVTSVSVQSAETPALAPSALQTTPPQAEAAEKSPYLVVPSVPVIEGGQGVRFDFNDGARVMVPDIAPEIGQWHVRLSDYSTGNILFDARLKGGMVASTKKFFVPFLIDVWLEKPDGTREDVLHHELS